MPLGSWQVRALQKLAGNIFHACVKDGASFLSKGNGQVTVPGSVTKLVHHGHCARTLKMVLFLWPFAEMPQ